MSTEPEVNVSADASAPQPGQDSTATADSQPKQPDRYECRSCGYVYEPAKGDNTANIAAGTPFSQLPASWRCPVCGVRKPQFENIGPTGKPSGFEENLGYGLGVNTLTPGQKNLLIFGALGLGFLFFLSLYGLG
ncbi:MAG: rubredoxin [Leptolyngbya sp. SIO4C5]|nr:rubredoxin [Leptolyngbya sp. SIO4C5]